jgi:hypothetical protein
MDLATLFSFKFWFSLFPGYTSEVTLQTLGGVFLAALFLFIIFFFSKNKTQSINKKVFSNLSYLFLSFGLLGFVWLFFLYEEVYLLGARFWLLILILGHLVWLAKIVLYLKLRLPKEKEEQEKKKTFRKYLP